MNHADPLDRPFDPSMALPAIAAIRTPRIVRFLGHVLLLAVLVTPFILVFVPWQQTVRGRGRVVAFDPGEREQAVTANISGQIARWYVKETDRVKVGDQIVDIVDTDPDYGVRLEKQRTLIEDQIRQVRQQIEQQRLVINEQVKARDSAVMAAKALQDAKEKGVEKVNADITANEAVVAVNRETYTRLEGLFNKGGLESKLDVLKAEAALKESEANGAALQQQLKQAQAEVLQAKATIDKAQADGDSAVATASGALRKMEQEVPILDRQLQQLDNQIRRYESRLVLSPCDGIVYRIMPDASQVGQYVKEGQTLASIVPDAGERVVELTIDGVDASLITRDEQTGEYPRVRLQFEGWPAVQFSSGWPEASVGTFGGRVARVDPTDDGSGRFRILVKPEPYYEGDEWPDPEYLRQGNQAVGWAFLDRVPLGWELWRRMNGFPPVEPPRKSDDPSKPPKVGPK